MSARTTESELNDSSEISDAELAQFLKTIAVAYESPVTGNPALARALKALASSISAKKRSGRVTPKAKARGAKEPGLDFSVLQGLDSAAVRAFVADSGKTKFELIDLASARFSIPRSQLKRMTTDDVREALKTALLHEGSIEIIAQEASREGAERNS